MLDGRRGLAILVDPDRTTAADAAALASRGAGEGVALFLLGNSFGEDGNTERVGEALRAAACGVPVIQFPATASQLVPVVDAVLLLSLVSGRNPQYLIEEHVRAVPFFRRHPEVVPISTAYLLVDGGEVTTVESVSQTRPLPAGKAEILAAHVEAAMLIGMQATYVDAGSGAPRAVSQPMIRAARAAARGALFVGGGIADAAGVRAAREAGADFVVVGSLLERERSRMVRDLALAAGA
ncbi:MAG: phosphoglycerol geranylgeranyltransferase [Gemmatimonadetes bacterium]|nr:phosphoglycerol geranylgeranyltransferase [Gemmatimonadota bacterium]